MTFGRAGPSQPPWHGAAVAARALTEDGHHGRSYPLTGAESAPGPWCDGRRTAPPPRPGRGRDSAPSRVSGWRSWRDGTEHGRKRSSGARCRGSPTSPPPTRLDDGLPPTRAHGFRSTCPAIVPSPRRPTRGPRTMSATGGAALDSAHLTPTLPVMDGAAEQVSAHGGPVDGQHLEVNIQTRL